MTDLACPVDGCYGLHAVEHVTCRRCWRLVPDPVRARVWRTWRGRQRTPDDPHAVAAHEQAKADAISDAAAALERAAPGQGRLL